MAHRIGEVVRAIESARTSPAPIAKAAPPTAVTVESPDLTPYLAKLDETLLALRELHAARLPIAATPSPAPPSNADLISRESYLINGTLIPLLRFMAPRFKSYRAVSDPRIKQAIANLERVQDLGGLETTLESISVSALSTLTEERRG